MEDVPVPTVIKLTAAAQAARDAAFRMIPEELRDGLGQITDVLPVMLRDAPLRSRRRDLRRGRDVGNDEAYEEAGEDLKRRMMAPANRRAAFNTSADGPRTGANRAGFLCARRGPSR